MGQAFTSCLNQYVATGSGYIGIVIMILILYGAWGACTYYLLEYFMTDSDVNKFHDGVSTILFVVSVVYLWWITPSRSIMSQPRALRILQEHIKILGRNLYSIHTCVHLIHCEKKNNNFDGNSTDETEKKMIEDDNAFREVYKCLISLAHYSLRMFLDHDYIDAPVEFDLNVIKKQPVLYNHQGRGFSGNSSSKKNPEFTRLFSLSNNRELVERCQEHLLTGINFLELKKIITSAQYQVLNLHYATITGTQGLAESTVNLEVREPPFLQHWLVFVLYVYFLIFFPFDMFLRIRDLMLYIYAPVVTLFTGPYIIRVFLGDPMDRKNPQGTETYFQWRKQLVDYLIRKCNETCNIRYDNQQCQLDDNNRIIEVNEVLHHNSFTKTSNAYQSSF